MASRMMLRVAMLLLLLLLPKVLVIRKTQVAFASRLSISF
jgi:hypothetical protein